MFRNSPDVDGGGTAYLGPTTIIEMTIPMSQSSSGATLDDSWVLAGPITDKLAKEGFTQQKKLMCLHTCTKLTTLKGLLFNSSTVLFHLPTKPLYSFSCHSHVLKICSSVISFYILRKIITPGNEFCIKHRKSETDHFKLIIMMQLLSKTVLRLLYIYI